MYAYLTIITYKYLYGLKYAYQILITYKSLYSLK